MGKPLFNGDLFCCAMAWLVLTMFAFMSFFQWYSRRAWSDVMPRRHRSARRKNRTGPQPSHDINALEPEVYACTSVPVRPCCPSPRARMRADVLDACAAGPEPRQLGGSNGSNKSVPASGPRLVEGQRAGCATRATQSNGFNEGVPASGPRRVEGQRAWRAARAADGGKASARSKSYHEGVPAPGPRLVEGPRRVDEQRAADGGKASGSPGNRRPSHSHVASHTHTFSLSVQGGGKQRHAPKTRSRTPVPHQGNQFSCAGLREHGSSSDFSSSSCIFDDSASFSELAGEACRHFQVRNSVSNSTLTCTFLPLSAQFSVQLCTCLRDVGPYQVSRFELWRNKDLWNALKREWNKRQAGVELLEEDEEGCFEEDQEELHYEEGHCQQHANPLQYQQTGARVEGRLGGRQKLMSSWQREDEEGDYEEDQEEGRYEERHCQQHTHVEQYQETGERVDGRGGRQKLMSSWHR